MCIPFPGYSFKIIVFNINMFAFPLLNQSSHTLTQKSPHVSQVTWNLKKHFCYQSVQFLNSLSVLCTGVRSNILKTNALIFTLTNIGCLSIWAPAWFSRKHNVPCLSLLPNVVSLTVNMGSWNLIKASTHIFSPYPLPVMHIELDKGFA